MYAVVTLFLVLITYNTWTGEKLETRSYQWTVGIPEYVSPRQILIEEIELCRIKGVAEAIKMSGYYNARGILSASTNVDCEWEMGQGT